MRIWLVIAALLGGLGVIVGAVGAHAVKGLGPVQQHTFETGTAFQMYHALAIGLAALAMRDSNRGPAQLAAQLFLTGTLLFSFSLYLWALSGQHFYVFITPVGGVALIMGWVALAVAGWKLEKT